MNKNNSFDKQINDWGREARQLPADNESCKQKILSAVRPAERRISIKRPRPILFRFAVLATAAASILLVMANPGLFNSSTKQKNLIYRENSGAVDLGLTYGEDIGLGKADRSIVQTVVQSFKTESLELDTREYLDTSYYATINTRDVKKISDQTKTIIRGHFGRIDSLSENPKSARIAFTLPKSELDQMVTELKDLVPEKMYLETTYAENRLTEKQNIETSTGNTLDELNRLQNERANVVASYEKQLNAIQSRIDSIARSLNTNYALRAVTTNTTKLAQIDAEINRLAKQRASSEQEYRNVKSQENKELTAIDYSIDAQNNLLNNLGKQDDKLMAEVETVTGSVSVQWVSYWDILNIYLPMRPIVISLIVLSAAYLIFRRRVRPIDIPL